VYRAADLQVPDHIVALKLFHRLALDAAARDAALRELRLIASVSHPSVVQFKDYGWHGGRAFFVMPFYRGETLRQRLGRGPLSRVEAKSIFLPLARALASMHGTGVRHQDIKPENIFLAHPDDTDQEVLPVLIDLGVAAKDAENVLAGTPNYFAPEVAARFGHEPDPPFVTGKADVFALALVLRNALDPEAEEQVAAGAVDAFVRYRARRAPPPPRRRDLAYLRSAFERWLHLAPDQRPTADSLARELSVLTLPEERRARTLATLRWLVPIVVMLAAVFSAAVFALSREAELQRKEAMRARQVAQLERSRAEEASQRAARIRDDLAKAHEASRALKEDVARLEEQYRSSRMTRIELAERLAHTESALTLLSKQRDDELKQLSDELAELVNDRDAVRAQLQATQGNLQDERRRAAALDDKLQEVQAELEASTKAVEAAQTRERDLHEALVALQKATAPKPRAPVAAQPAGNERRPR
jgi:serine/threonine protein kinase